MLKLTYKTLEQINSMAEESQEGAAGGGAGGPMWNRFWNSFGQTGSVGSTGAGGDDAESAFSGSQRPSEFFTGDVPSTPGRASRDDFNNSDVHPNDSASAVGAPVNDDGASAVGVGGLAVAGSADVDDGTYLFKFSTPGRKTHRFQARYDTFETIREIVGIKLSSDDFFSHPPPAPTGGEEDATAKEMTKPDPEDFTLAYEDDENDIVLITADGDVLDAVQVARKQGRDRVVLLVQGGRSWEDALARFKAEQTPAVATPAAPKRRQREAVEAQLQSVEEEEERDDAAEVDENTTDPPKLPNGSAKKSAKAAKKDDELLFGVLPKDLALPAAIGFLGVAVLAAVVITRPSQR